MAIERSSPPTCNMTSTRRAPGAHRRKRTPPCLSCAPKGMRRRRQRLLGTGAFHQQRGRASLQWIGGCARVALNPKGILVARGVEQRTPCALLSELRQREGNGFVMRVEEHQEIAVFDNLSAPVDALDRRTRKIDTQTARELLIPFLLGHLASIRLKPHDL